MNYKVSTLRLFEKQAKRLLKKYPSLKSDLTQLIENLSTSPHQGIPLGDNFYKIRLAISSKGKGKSSGARVITFVKIIHGTVYLASIYDKSEKANITDKELEQIFKLLP